LNRPGTTTHNAGNQGQTGVALQKAKGPPAQEIVPAAIRTSASSSGAAGEQGFSQRSRHERGGRAMDDSIPALNA
jgi:hypothetical protein